MEIDNEAPMLDEIFTVGGCNADTGEAWDGNIDQTTNSNDCHDEHGQFCSTHSVGDKVTYSGPAAKMEGAWKVSKVYPDGRVMIAKGSKAVIVSGEHLYGVGGKKSISSEHLAAKIQEIDPRHNFVHLGDLHEHFPGVSKPDFHAAVKQARAEGKITLSAAEGRHGISEKDEASGFREEAGHGQSLMLYASTRE